MIRILNIEPEDYCEAARAILSQIGEVVERQIDREELLKTLSKFDVLVVRLANQIDREVIEAGARLKAIVTATTGLDHIDVDYAESRAMAVLSLKGEAEFLRTINATAEHTWALLLSLIRGIPGAFRSVCAGEWNRDRFKGSELGGRDLGIVGLGRIGRQVARYGAAFEMKVGAYDPYADDWPTDVRRFDTLTDLLQNSQIVSLHVPLNKETDNMLDTGQLALMRPDAVLVNTSRGGLVNETALVVALQNRLLAGAALDVVHHERDAEKHRHNPLIRYAQEYTNLIITPHIAGATLESMAKTEIFMARKLKQFIDDHSGKN